VAGGVESGAKQAARRHRASSSSSRERFEREKRIQERENAALEKYERNYDRETPNVMLLKLKTLVSCFTRRSARS
jgi:hypothetical protein